MGVCVRESMSELLKKERMLSLEGVLQIVWVCVCVYVWLCIMWSDRCIKIKKEMWRKKWEIWKTNKKSCYSVWPARALRINLAGVTVPDLNWREIEDPYFPEWFISRAWKGLRPPLQLYPVANSLCFCFRKKQKKTSTRGQICIMISNVFDSQFEFCRAVKDFRVAFFFFLTLIPISSVDGWMASMKSLFQQGKICLQTCVRMFAKN